MFEDIKFDKKGLVPAIVQDVYTKEVLMLAYMNKQSLEMTIETKRATFFSRSRNEIWVKGETSGNYQYVVDIKVDCDLDTVLLTVDKKGPACHTGEESCFYTSIEDDGSKSKIKNANNILRILYKVIEDRKENPKEGSYTNYLFDKGIDKILKKVGEENAEVIIASKNTDNDELIYETSDLIYHLLVLLVEKDITLDDIFNELNKRR